MTTTPQNRAAEQEVGVCHFDLDLKVWDAFNRALDRPPQVEPRLQRLFAESTILEKSGRRG
jgi:hypothetical protein